MTKKELKELIKEVIIENSDHDKSTINKAKLAYSALKKKEDEYRELSKKTNDPVKKQQFSDLAQKAKTKAADIFRSFARHFSWYVDNFDDFDIIDLFDDP